MRRGGTRRRRGAYIMEKIVLKVNGMSCSHCEAAVAKASESVDGVKKAKADLKKGCVTVEFDSAKAQPDAIKAAITEAGYEVA
jgi:copper ion binding protein